MPLCYALHTRATLPRLHYAAGASVPPSFDGGLPPPKPPTKPTHHPNNSSGALRPYSRRVALPHQQGPAALIAGCALGLLPLVAIPGHTTAGGFSGCRAVAPCGRNSPAPLQPRWCVVAPLWSPWLRPALLVSSRQGLRSGTKPAPAPPPLLKKAVSARGLAPSGLVYRLRVPLPLDLVCLYPPLPLDVYAGLRLAAPSWLATLRFTFGAYA